MWILRGIQKGRKVTLFLFLVLVSASSLVLINSRPSYAESPSLLGTVRCVLRTVLLTECAPSDTPAPLAPTPAPAPSSPSPAQSPSSGSTANASSAQAATSTPAAGAVAGAQDVALPDTALTNYPNIRSLTPASSTGYALNDSNYLAYFNSYSPYALAAGQEAAASGLVEASADGWKILGVAWYWWVVAAALLVAFITSVRRMILRRASVLPGGS